MRKITIARKLSTLIEYRALLSRKKMSISMNYTALHLETLEVILVMHVTQYEQLRADPMVNQHSILSLEKTIADVNYAISMKNEVKCSNCMHHD